MDGGGVKRKMSAGMNQQSKATEAAVKTRFWSLFVGLLVASSAIWLIHRARLNEEEAEALGKSTAVEITWRGVRLSAWYTPEVYAEALKSADVESLPRVGFWLGNSQLHTINNYQTGQEAGPRHASDALGWPMLGFSLPNANLQEHYVVAQWLLTKAKPEWVWLPVVFDDLREDGLRDSMQKLAVPETLESLRRRPTGAKLAAELEKLGKEKENFQGTTRKERSWQQKSEEFLEVRLSSVSSLWAGRGPVLARCYYALYHFRNWVFRIDPTTKRKIIPMRSAKNMAALAETLELMRERGVRCLVYVAPTRWDVEPPYELPAYETWKREVATMCRKYGCVFADVDRLVPAEHWGFYEGKELDFMHFTHEGHVLLGRKLAELSKAAVQ